MGGASSFHALSPCRISFTAQMVARRARASSNRIHLAPRHHTIRFLGAPHFTHRTSRSHDSLPHTWLPLAFLRYITFSFQRFLLYFSSSMLTSSQSVLLLCLLLLLHILWLLLCQLHLRLDVVRFHSLLLLVLLHRSFLVPFLIVVQLSPHLLVLLLPFPVFRVQSGLRVWPANSQVRRHADPFKC